MSIRQRLRRGQQRLALAVVASATCWAVAVALVMLAMRLPAVVAGFGAIVTAAALIWRGRGSFDPQRVALLVEEKQAGLGYALVTTADPHLADDTLAPALVAVAGGADIEGVVATLSRRAFGRGLLALLAGVSLYLLIPSGQRSTAVASGSGVTVAPEAPSRLTPLLARLVPPAYAGLPTRSVDEPATLAALPGTRVILTGKGVAAGVAIGVGPDTIAAGDSARGWRGGFTMPADPGIVTLSDRTFSRLIVLEPQPDSVPVVELLEPSRDTTYHSIPAAPIAIEARTSDDYGLASGYVEYMLSIGIGDNFETETRNGPRVDFQGKRSGTVRSRVRLDTMGLKPGSVLSIRVVVFDRNDVSGPGQGVSETRTLRIAEVIDSTSINPLPPDPIDEAYMSQRLLNMKTDTLIRARRRMGRPAFADRSLSYSNSQDAIRERVLMVVQTIEDDGVGGSAPTEVSNGLRDAADAMMSARLLLAVAEADSAMPHMRRALAILDELRLANRYYLRGLMQRVLVDVEKVRLQGKDRGTPSLRNPGLPTPELLQQLAARIEAAAQVYPRDQRAALDSLAYIQLAALKSLPALASSLREASSRLAGGTPLVEALAPVWRQVVPPPAAADGSAEWGVGLE